MIFLKLNKGDVADALFACAVRLDMLASSCPDDCYQIVRDLSDTLFNQSKNL